MARHVVNQGECLSSIAAEYGLHDWQVIYDHPENETFRKKRPNPNILHPGDALFIPEPKVKSAPCQTGQTTRFVLKRPRREFTLTLRDSNGAPLAYQAYALEVGGEMIEGTTDGDGALLERVPLSASTAVLRVGEDTWNIQFAALNPLHDTDDDGISGVQARLLNLGFDPGPVDGILSEQTQQALCAFEVLHGLAVTGEPVGKTLDKLKEVHNC